ncbi:MAG: ATP-binding protein [Nitrospina sp.]|nr:ATP-binding protein [Nitrospina sp.]
MDCSDKTMTQKSGQQLLLNFPSHPEYNFSNFVVSDGSRIAFETAKEFSNNSPSSFQSLYLFGQENLGKTHLLLSIGNRVAEQGLRAVCVQGNDFVEKMGQELSPDAESTLQQLLDVDFFLMDNVQGLSHSPLAQEKLYHIYNQIMEKGGKLAFTAGCPPEQNLAMESYLTSRFQWGMVAQIKPIDDATTAKIIVKLAKDINLTLPEPIINYLLSHISRDFISMKDAVSTINKESYFQKKKVTLPLVKMALNL